MGTVLTHPFLCLNRYKQNDRTTYIICYHSAPYSFTNKPEIGGAGRLTRPDTANSYARQPALINRLVYLHYTLCNGWQLQVSSASRLPLFRLARKVRISCYSCILIECSWIIMCISVQTKRRTGAACTQRKP